MALTSTDKSLCNKLVSDFQSLIAPGKMAKGAVKGASNDMKSKLSGMIYSDPTNLNNALSAYKNQVDGNLPGASEADLNNIKKFIDGCEYLQFLSPVSAMVGTITGIFDEIGKLINGFDLSFPEFGAGGFGSLIDKILDGVNIPGGDKISSLLALADKLLDCLSNSCASIDPSYIGDLNRMSDELEDTYKALGVVDDPNDPNYGKFDYSKLYNDVGMTGDEIAAIQKTKSGINVSKDAGSDAVKNTVDAIKKATKLGVF